jgi:formate hydrogenlyase transcriptional activator
MTAQSQSTLWLLENGPKELESLFRAIVSHPSAPILITDDDRHCHEASSGASKLLGLPREKIIGRSLDDFSVPGRTPLTSECWQAFLEEGEQTGTLQLLGLDGTPREVKYTARGNLLPVRHLLLFQDSQSHISGEPDYALFLLNAEGQIAAWYAGAERTYGFKSDEATGRHVAILRPEEDAFGKLQEQLKRAVTGGHFADECWQVRKNGSRFWGNVITMALKDKNGDLQGFASVVRDFSNRQHWDEKLRVNRARALPPESSVTGIVSGEFDRIPEANDVFLELVGYTRGDLLEGRLVWADLTPPEFVALDEFAHEEDLRFGACTPFEKELIRKDGTRVSVLVSTALLKLSPFRWITFVTELRDRDQLEDVDFEGVEVTRHFEEFVGTSAAMRRVMRQVEVVAPTDATVLIVGETGTGKELVVRAIHRLSTRRNLPFISLNCAAIPTGLLESELFGHERGAFTGALGQKIGRFEMANQGTLFLDEVGDIPLDLQPKLLRALQEKALERLGGTRTIPIDVRLVAATNRNLTQMMGDKLFRSDLYYRLKVFPITTSPLRDHPEDIPLLVWHFTKKYAAKMGRTINKIPSETMEKLMVWSWPGNVRELENFIERSVILSHGPSLRAPIEELRAEALVAGGDTLERIERNHILRILRETGGVVSVAANRLGMPRTTLHTMMNKLKLSRSDL